MFGIPEWAIGVTAIILVASTCIAVLRLLGVPVGGRTARLSRQDASELRAARHSAVLDDMQRRINELEERMDFAERLLAKERDAERIAPPKS